MPQLNYGQIIPVFKKLLVWLPKVFNLIEDSFLNEKNKLHYKELITQQTNLFMQLEKELDNKN